MTSHSTQITLRGEEAIEVGEINVKSHPVMSGIQSLYSGTSVSCIHGGLEEFKELAATPSGGVTIFAKDVSRQFPSPGRVLVDTGFSKLLHLAKPDVLKYVANCAVWLLSLDYRIRKNAELRGSLQPKANVEVSCILPKDTKNSSPPVHLAVSPWRLVQLRRSGLQDGRSSLSRVSRQPRQE